MRQHGVVPTILADNWFRSALQQQLPGAGGQHYGTRPLSGLEHRELERVFLEEPVWGKHPELEAFFRKERVFGNDRDGFTTWKGANWRPTYTYDAPRELAPMVPWLAQHLRRWLELWLDGSTVNALGDETEVPYNMRPILHDLAKKAKVSRFSPGGEAYAIQGELVQLYAREMRQLLGARVPHGGLPGQYWPAAIGLPGFRDWLESPAGAHAWTLDPQEAFLAARAWHDELAQLREGQALPGVVIATWPDGSTLHRLVTRQQLQGEGDAMGHCVGGYWRQVREGGHVILSLRNPDGDSVATLDMISGHTRELHDLEGPENEEIEDIEDQRKVAGLLEALEVDPDEFWAKIPGIPLKLHEDALEEVRKADDRLEAALSGARKIEEALPRVMELIARFNADEEEDEDLIWATRDLDKEVGWPDIEDFWEGDRHDAEDWVHRLEGSMRSQLYDLNHEEITERAREVLGELEGVLAEIAWTPPQRHENALSATLHGGILVSVEWDPDSFELGLLEESSEGPQEEGRWISHGDVAGAAAEGIQGLHRLRPMKEPLPKPQWVDPTWQLLVDPRLSVFLRRARELGLDLDRNAQRLLKG